MPLERVDVSGSTCRDDVRSAVSDRTFVHLVLIDCSFDGELEIPRGVVAADLKGCRMDRLVARQPGSFSLRCDGGDIREVAIEPARSEKPTDRVRSSEGHDDDEDECDGDGNEPTLLGDLELVHCGLERLSVSTPLQALYGMNLRGNHMTTFDVPADVLPVLMRLDLRDNRIQHVAVRLPRTLNELWIAGNSPDIRFRHAGFLFAGPKPGSNDGPSEYRSYMDRIAGDCMETLTGFDEIRFHPYALMDVFAAVQDDDEVDVDLKHIHPDV